MPPEPSAAEEASALPPDSLAIVPCGAAGVATVAEYYYACAASVYQVGAAQACNRSLCIAGAQGTIWIDSTAWWVRT